MMPDLGKYAFAVLASYGVSIALISGLVALSFWQRARVKRALDEVEARVGRGSSDG
ncbi:heme exporter protein CcmD [Neotabrizicola sp. sgz301269]|uniref:heme exporter protein CcmD n=1 Tax=Neotabrizicola sp. sgz301269 TaxID=3276282 RepID=UPI00376FB325